MTSKKSKNPSRNSDSSTNNATKVAWIGFAGVLLAALIAAGVTLFSQSQNNQGTTQSVGDGTTGTVNQAGRDIHNEN